MACPTGGAHFPKSAPPQILWFLGPHGTYLTGISLGKNGTFQVARAGHGFQGKPRGKKEKTQTYCGWTVSDGYPVNANQQWVPMVSKWCRISSIHSMLAHFSGKRQGQTFLGRSVQVVSTMLVGGKVWLEGKNTIREFT